MQVSSGLDRRAVIKIMAARDFAAQTGAPLNMHVILALEVSGILGRAQDALGHILENKRKWLGRRGIQAHYVWVLERGSELGVHAHIFVHVPAGQTYRDFKAKWPDWIKQAGGEILRGGTHKTVVCKDARNPETLTQYLVKGVRADAAAWAEQALGVRRVDQGIIMGRRNQVSGSISTAAQKAWHARQADLAA